jgi:GNAT superfamily N-acetyltransferase
MRGVNKKMPLWKIRMFEEGDQTDVVNLMNLVYPGVRFDARSWSWKYESAPRGFLAAVAEHDGKIVGHMGLQLVGMKVGKAVITGSQACDLCVHPGYVRQGMFLAMGKALMKAASENEVLLTYGFPNEPAYYGHLKYGWFDVAKIQTLTTHLGTHKGVIGQFETLNRIEPLIEKCSRFIDWFLSLRRQYSYPSIEDLELSTISRFDESVDQLWSRTSKDFDIAIVRDHKHLNWRYFARPDIKYTTLVAKKNMRVEGYVVFVVRRSGNRNVGLIVDALAASKEALSCLVGVLIADLSKRHADSIRCWMQKGFLEHDALRQMGFVSWSVPQKFHGRLIARINSKVLFQPYKDAKKWYITSGDSDLS